MSSPRANRDGHLCPPWCAVDHDKEAFPGYHLKSHGAEGVIVGSTLIRASLGASQSAPDIQVSTHVGSPQERGSFYIGVEDAPYVAALFEHLATATPAEHCEIAAAIRAAADVIKGDDNDERAGHG